MRAEALMAMTNLGSDVECEGLEADQSVISVLTQMALCAIQGEAWREVAWYDTQECIRPTSRLTLNPVNRVHYRNSGLIPVLKQLLGRSDLCTHPHQHTTLLKQRVEIRCRIQAAPCSKQIT
jgi:hypothetical protein